MTKETIIKLVETVTEQFEEYAHQEDFDLYDLEEKVFEKFQIVQRMMLQTTLNEHTHLKKNSIEEMPNMWSSFKT